MGVLVSDDASQPPELCGEVELDTIGGQAYLQRWWTPRVHAEQLRFTRVPSSDGATPEDQLVSEAELIGLLDSAWGNGLLSDFVRRQLFYMVMRRYEEDPAALWAVGPTEVDD